MEVEKIKPPETNELNCNLTPDEALLQDSSNTVNENVSFCVAVFSALVCFLAVNVKFPKHLHIDVMVSVKKFEPLFFQKDPRNCFYLLIILICD